MNFDLVQHRADSVQLGVEFRARLEPKPNKLILTYTLRGFLQNLILPRPDKSLERLDNLWQNTCFEAFFKLKDSPKYIELNLSPFSAYNAYIFTDYRLAMLDYELPQPVFSSEKDKDFYSFIAKIENLDLEQFSALSITAIIKLKSGETTHWAIKHASEKPDFHLSNSFIKL